MGCFSSQPAEPQANAPAPAPGEEGESEAVKKQRRRLSVAPQHAGKSGITGGVLLAAEAQENANLTPLELQAKGTIRQAVCSKKGLVPYNKNKVNQDRFVFKYAVGDDPSVNMWGVMDGHGEYGHYVAAFVQEHLPATLSLEKNIKLNPEQSITNAVKVMCDRLQQTDINCSFSGSTLVFGVSIDKTLYVANVGDSRCVLCRQNEKGEPVAIPLSIDQKPERPSEKARIEACGGRVEPLPGPPGECGPPRVWLAEADVPGLAMSRSIGDEVSQTVGVISVPEISTHQIEGNDVFAVWASDGVWEFIDNEAAIALLWKNKNNLQEAANALAEESTKQWKKEEEVIDDITCIIVQFNTPK